MFSRAIENTATLRHGLGACLTTALILGFSVPTSALELNVATTLTARHSDNAFREDDGDIDNVSLEPGILLGAQHQGPNLQADIDYLFERRFHTNKGNRERNFARGSASLNWQAIPQRLSFNINQTSTESLRNTTQAGAPNQRGVTHNTSAGPTLSFGLRDTDQIRFTYLYEDRSSNLDETDSESNIFSGSYVFTLSEYTSLIAEHRESRISFSTVLATDLDSTQQTLSYIYRNNSTLLELVGGYSEFERDGAEDVGGETAEINWQKTFSSSSIALFGRRAISNQSSRLFQNLGQFDREEFDLFIDTNIAEVFIETGYGLTLTQDVGATQFRFVASTFRYDYEELTPDTTQYQITVGASRRANRNLAVNIAARYLNQEVDDLEETLVNAARPGQTTKLYTIIASFDWSIASNLDVSGGFEYRTRADGFDETVSFATITYALFGRN